MATADLLVEQKRAGDAVQKLSAIILSFADEGRYVPRMLDRAEEIHNMLGGSRADLVAFYQKLLPEDPPQARRFAKPLCHQDVPAGNRVFQRQQPPGPGRRDVRQARHPPSRHVTANTHVRFSKRA